MKLKLLSLAAAFGTSSASSDNNNLLRHDEKTTHRDLQASIACIIGGGNALDCCRTDPKADGVCTLLTCVDITADSVTANEACSCSQIDKACESVSAVGAMVPGLLDMCGQVNTCCNSGAASVTEFNGCIGTAISDGIIPNIPDFDSLLPGDGLPDLSELLPEVGENLTSGTAATSPTVPNGSGDPCTICAGVTVDDNQTVGESGMTCAQIIATTEGTGQCAISKESIEKGCCPAAGDATTVAATLPAVTTTTDATPPAATTTVPATEPPPGGSGAGSKYEVEAFMYVMGTLMAMVFV